ncbi:hypothetical protein MUNTM_41320 [Mycobacterium sp. MUNTM1]
MNTPPIVSAQQWASAHRQLLAKEKELTRAHDALAAMRRRMPWTAVDKRYEFDGPEGRVDLPGLFQGRRQLVVYRAFYGAGIDGWPDHACRGCSMIADHVGNLARLNARDTTLVFASRAPRADIERLKARMDWKMPWYTIIDDFDADFGVDEWHGTNAFIHDGDRVFRTYFVNNRGDEALGTTWSFLDMTALAARKTGRIRRRAARRPLHTSGGTGTTRTASMSRRGGSASPTRTTPTTNGRRARSKGRQANCNLVRKTRIRGSRRTATRALFKATGIRQRIRWCALSTWYPAGNDFSMTCRWWSTLDSSSRTTQLSPSAFDSRTMYR